MQISKETHFKLAFFWWGIVGTGLLIAGTIFLFGGRSLSILNSGEPASKTTELIGLAVGLVVGFIKGHFVFRKISRKYMDRIGHLPERSPIYMTFSGKSWFLILVMISLGRVIRSIGTPHFIVGTIYVAVGFALVLGSRNYLMGAS